MLSRLTRRVPPVQSPHSCQSIVVVAIVYTYSKPFYQRVIRNRVYTSTLILLPKWLRLAPNPEYKTRLEALDSSHTIRTPPCLSRYVFTSQFNLTSIPPTRLQPTCSLTSCSHTRSPRARRPLRLSYPLSASQTRLHPTQD